MLKVKMKSGKNKIFIFCELVVVAFVVVGGASVVVTFS